MPATFAISAAADIEVKGGRAWHVNPRLLGGCGQYVIKTGAALVGISGAVELSTMDIS
jgi:hypothetical protein